MNFVLSRRLKSINRRFFSELTHNKYDSVLGTLLRNLSNLPSLTSCCTRDVTADIRGIRYVFHKAGLPYSEQSRLFSRCLSRDPQFKKLADGFPKIRREFQTSSGHHQQGQGNKDDDKKKPNDDNDKFSSIAAKALIWLLMGYMLVAIVTVMVPGQREPETVRYVSWNEFVHHMLSKGEVEEIIVRPDLDLVTINLYEGAVVKGRKAENLTFHMNIVDTNKFEEKLREAEKRLGIVTGGGVQIVYERGADTAGKLLASIIVASILLSLFARARSVKPNIPTDTFSQMGRANFTLVDPHMASVQGKGVKFTDVAGLQEAKLEVMEIVDYLKRPQHYKNLGAKVPKGALLLGPPGCGKTLLAKAVATEAQVPFLSMNGSEFIEMIGGLGAARVRDLFKEGRKRSPCIIYIDEIDALGRKRTTSKGPLDGSAGEGEQTLNQLLVEMDGIASKEGVLMLASTNRADVLDKALLRPGRFDRHILIDLPTLAERTEIFEYHLKKIALESPPNTYSKRLAHLTPGFSGADIANVCNEAALHAARFTKKKVAREDLEYAIERILGGTEKRTNMMTPTEKRIVACHESGHALVGWMLPNTDLLLKVTIVPRTNLALGFAQYTPSDQKLYSKEELFGKMCMALGGRAAEALTFNRITTGGQNDLEKVTKMAYGMVRTFGMNRTVGLISFTEGELEGMKPYSKSLAGLIDLEARHLVGEAYKATEQLLKDNADKLQKMTEELLKHETLNYDDVVKILGPPLNGKRKLVDSVEFEQSLNEAVPKEPRESDDREKSPT